MITGIHAMFYTRSADELRAFLRDVLELPWVDAGGNWPIFAAPPTDLAVHETDENTGHELYFICDDIQDVVRKLEAHGIRTTAPVTDRGWGLATELQLPSGDVIGIYEPRHPRPHKHKARKAKHAKAKRAKIKRTKKKSHARPVTKKRAAPRSKAKARKKRR